MDGILSLMWIVIWYAVAIVFIALGVREIKEKRKGNPVYTPMLGLMGAAVFIISVWHIPVPVTGSCSHPVGTPMAAVLIGPFANAVLSAIALFFQTFLAHGGLTTIGANDVSMGIVGGFSGYFVYRGVRKMGASFWLSGGLGGLTGDGLTYITTALQLALSLHPESVMRHWGIFIIGFLPTQIPLMILEFFLTAMTFRYIVDRRPELLKY